MTGSRAAIRYAKALFQWTKELNLTDAVFHDMQVVFEAVSTHKELKNMLRSPLIKRSDKEEALLAIFNDCTEETKSLINVLSENQRTNLLGAVSSHFIAMCNEERGVKVAQVTTAVPLSLEIESKVMAKIKELTGSTKVTLENRVDESILGGFILRIGDMQYNASISNKLAKIKREFSKSI